MSLLIFQKAKAPEARCQVWVASGVNFIHLIIELPAGGYMFRIYDVNDMSKPAYFGTEATKAEAVIACNTFDDGWEEPS
jgi:hypothetical protein